MSHWLEAEEQIQSSGSKGNSDSMRIKRAEIQSNYALVSKKYKTFLDELYDLTDRVNALPLQSRADFVSIDGKEKDSKLDNHLNIFSSSRRKYKASFLEFFRFAKKKKYKNIRVVYFNVSSRQGMIDIEVKERTLLRLSMRDNQADDDDSQRVTRQVHVISSFPVELLDHEFALGVIDWLAFKQDSSNSAIIGKLKQHGLIKK